MCARSAPHTCRGSVVMQHRLGRDSEAMIFATAVQGVGEMSAHHCGRVVVPHLHVPVVQRSEHPRLVRVNVDAFHSAARKDKARRVEALQMLLLCECLIYLMCCVVGAFWLSIPSASRV